MSLLEILGYILLVPFSCWIIFYILFKIVDWVICVMDRDKEWLVVGLCGILFVIGLVILSYV
jgi:hypothetical protein